MREVRVRIPRSLAADLAVACDGTKEMAEVVTGLGRRWPRDQVRRLLRQLFARGVLLDAGDLSTHVWRFFENPSPWISSALPDGVVQALVADQELQRPRARPAASLRASHNRLTRLVVRRRSQTSFTAKAVSEAALARMLWSAYGAVGPRDWHSALLPRRTVPSAGALYPLNLYLCLLKRAGQVRAGLYRATSSRPFAVDLERLSGKPAEIQSCLIQDCLGNASGVIVVIGRIGRSAIKYGNRAVPFVLLEAGHAVQNVHLSAIADGIGTLEIGGFVESALVGLLGLDPADVPLIAVVFGSRSRLSGHETRRLALV